MINVGSISDQTLAGIVTTATHGSGITYGVMSTHVLSLTLLLADGSKVSCSRQQNPDLFIATICGLGSTGLILTIQLEVEPAFRLKEVQETVDFDYGIKNLDDIVSSAEHVRFWWFPTAGTIRVSCADRTQEVSWTQPAMEDVINLPLQPKKPVGSWLWHSLLGYHLVQFLLFIARYFLFLNPYIGRFGAWLLRDPTVGVDDSHLIFNVDCRVSKSLDLYFHLQMIIPFLCSTLNILRNGQYRTPELERVS
jgi:L-gulonolactone oxidase